MPAIDDVFPEPQHAATTWRQIVDSATDTALIVTDRAGRVAIWSEGATRLLGWSESEMRNEDLSRIFADEDHRMGVIESEMAHALATGRGGGGEGWRVRKGGERFWAIGEMTPLRDPAGTHVGFVKILRDRTVQRRNYEALLERTRALEVLNQAVSALASAHDLQALLQIVTDAGVDLTGAEFGAFFYRVAEDDIYTLAAQSGTPPEAFAALPMSQTAPAFKPVFSAKGIIRSARIDGFSHNDSGAILTDTLEGCSPYCSSMSVPVVSRNGRPLGGLIFGHTLSGAFTAHSAAGLRALASEAAVAIDNTNLAQQRLAAEQALRELNERLEHEVRDRTEELERKAEALRQSQKMEAIGQLTGGVAHDFNNLLQVIVGNLELVRRSMPSDAGRLIRAVNAAMNGARRAATLTQRLLAFARRQPLAPKALDINALINGLSELLPRTLGETIAVETVLAAGLWRVETDPNELENTIINLAVNARDAMPHGGQLTIETANAHIDEAYASAHAEVRAGQYVLLSVSDSGFGMDADTVRQAFEPFFTTKPVGKGTGLGLSQVYGFVKQSGGHVKIYSEPALGTTVRIYLPRLLADPSPSELPVQDSSIPEAAARETILVVEDDEDVRCYSVESLRELGYHVLEAADGPAALDLLRANTSVSALFTDVVLPGGMTGAQLAAQAKGLRPALRILFTTGYARNAVVHQGKLDAGVQLLTKPFSFTDLATRIRDVLDSKD